MQQAARVLILVIACVGSAQGAPPDEDDGGWSAYGGDAGGNRYSGATQVNRDNVGRLRIAWTFQTGELGLGFARADKLAFEATPILAAGMLYLSTPTNIVIALDPATGAQRWRYDPHIPRNMRYSEATSRGVTSWLDPEAEAGAPCSHRIFIGTLDARLIAIDGGSGQPCKDFGTSGAVDLASGVRARSHDDGGDYVVTSPPAIYRDLVIVGAAIGGNRDVDTQRGIVRAFDVHTGVMRWSWSAPTPTLPRRPGEGESSYPRPPGSYPLPRSPGEGRGGGISSLPRDTREGRGGGIFSLPRDTKEGRGEGIFSVDAGRGLLFVPTGSAGPGYFRGERHNDTFANSLVALFADTGELVWHRQLVHHDLWNYDVPAQPLLVELEREGKSIAAVVQATMTGQLFVFDRETGEPVFDVIERPVPASNVPGETAAFTQPFPITPPLVSHAAVTPQDAWGLTFIDRGRCRDLIGQYRSEGIFTPPSLQGTIVTPGIGAGVNWGSLAFDNERQLVLAAINHLPTVATLVPRQQLQAMQQMPQWARSEFAQQEGAPYALRREPLLSPLGLPCTAPPWGTLAAVDLRRNSIRWQVALGSTRDATPWYFPRRNLGMPNMGGPMITAGGLAFIGAATDNYLRAFDVDTGRELWRGRLPAGGQATPMSYEAAGRQFVVIAAGGHGDLGTTRGDHVVAFALPSP